MCLQTPKYSSDHTNRDFLKLVKKVNEVVRKQNSRMLSYRSLFLGTAILLCFSINIYLIWSAQSSSIYFFSCITLGVLSVPLVLVVGHEAIHGNFSKFKWANNIGKHVFILIGTSSYFWELRHLKAHHQFTNIRDWDLDIEQSKLIRLNQEQQHSKYHKYQHIYMPFMFMFYTLNWFLFRDFKDIKRKTFGSREYNNHPWLHILFLFVAKVWHLNYLITIPLIIGTSLSSTIIGFLIFHISASFTTTLVLVSTHIGEEQELIQLDQEDKKLGSWAEHQIRTSANFSTSSSLVLHFFGGFNHHLTHHLFPNIPYALYPKITPLIQKYCENQDLPYMSYDHIGQAIFSHFKRLKNHSVL